MRAGIGLLVLLITVALMMLLYTGMPGMGPGYLKTVQQGGQRGTAVVNVVAGTDPSGRKFVDSITFRKRGSDYTVRSVMRGGPAEVWFGFKVDDQVLRVGPHEVKDGFIINDADSFVLWLEDAYRRQQTVMVRRDGKEVELPTPSHRLANKGKIPSLAEFGAGGVPGQ